MWKVSSLLVLLSPSWFSIFQCALREIVCSYMEIDIYVYDDECILEGSEPKRNALATSFSWICQVTLISTLFSFSVLPKRQTAAADTDRFTQIQIQMQIEQNGLCVTIAIQRLDPLTLSVCLTATARSNNYL